MIFSESSLTFYRTALNFSLDCNNVLLQGARRVRSYQIEQIEAAMADCSMLSKKLEKASNSEELLTFGSELLSDQIERTRGYWSGMSNALGQNQAELTGVFQSRAVELADGLKQQLDHTPAAIPEPLAATLKMVAEVVHNTLSTKQQPMRSTHGNGAQHAGRGKHQDAGAQQARHH